MANSFLDPTATFVKFKISNNSGHALNFKLPACGVFYIDLWNLKLFNLRHG
jgi:hypothetical protein